MQQTTTPCPIDPVYTLSHQQWTVSLVRRKLAARPYHVYLIALGLNQFGTAEIRRYDFVEPEKTPGFGDIVIRSYGGIALNQLPSAFEAAVKFGGDTDALFHKTWTITLEQAAALNKNITQEKESLDNGTLQLPYSVQGDTGSMSAGGQNCFGWAKRQLRALQAPNIDIPDHWTAKVIDSPLFDLQEPTSGQQCVMM